MNSPLYLPASAHGRRHFVQGLAAGGALLGLSPFTSSALLRDARAAGAGPAVPQLSGTEFHLEVSELPVNYTGNPRIGVAINGSIPAPTLRWREGDEVTLRVTNHLRQDTSIHWHGIILPYPMDGVPGISFSGIPPGATFTYRFKVAQSGTYWYHSHSNMQEAVGMYGAIIVEPRDGERIRADREHVVLLSDWTDEDLMAVMHKLKVHSAYYNHHQPTVLDFFRDVSDKGLKAAFDKRRMWNEMRMSPTDLGDLSADTLTYLMNGATPAGNWTGLFRPGERVRLRFINGSAHTFYDVRIPGLKLTIVQTDGVDVEPVTVDEFRCGPGETYDALVQPREEAYTVFAQSMERTGYARGTLAARPGLQAEVPALDRRVWLSMTDMMGSMDQGSMDHGSMEQDEMAGMGHAGMAHGAMGHDATGPGETASGAGHEGMGHDSPDMVGMDHAVHGGHEAHGGQGMTGMQASANPLARPSIVARHARTEYGPSTDMRVDTARTNLDDPGVGLRDNGRRVLTLADLRTLGGPLDPRGPGREVELHLTGHMERYSWSLDGLAFGQSTPVRMNYGERLRVILHNDTMMTHPMHLHGLWSELEDADGRFVARKHTLPVQPAQRVSFLVTADALGRWAWHCHLMLHMHAGMFREVVVA